MLKRPIATLCAVLLLGGLFLYGVLQLFALRYEAGDAYPPYSSFRADPLGAKAIYEALGALPDVKVRRNFRPLPRLKPLKPVMLVYAGIERHSYWADNELETFESLVHGGTRAIFAFYPMDRPPSEKDDTSGAQNQKAKKQQRGDEVEEQKDGLTEFSEVAKKWGFKFAYLPAPEEKAFDRKAALMEAGSGLETDLTWHSAIYFDELSPEWKVLYTCDLKPVVIERKFGEGSLLLAGDSFFLSNEALRTERHSRFLARVFTGPSDVVFDEEHLDVREQPGIATLARKYGLQGAAAVLVLLAVLFVWKNASRFLPAYGDAERDDVVGGKEAAEGFVNLLRRTIKPSEILTACVEEWRKVFTNPRDRVKFDAAWEQEKNAPPKQRDPVAAYRTLSQTVNRR